MADVAQAAEGNRLHPVTPEPEEVQDSQIHLQGSKSSKGESKSKNDDVCCGLSTALIILWSVGLALLLVNMALAAVLLYKYEDCNTDPEEPPIPGAMPGSSKPTIILAMDTNYPPYAETAPPVDGLQLGGFGADFARGINDNGEIEILLTETRWANCWSDGAIGVGAASGWYHGCMTYTHTRGQRPRFMEFSRSILGLNKPAGLLARISGGVPAVNGASTLNGLKVADVNGWAPTADTLQLLENPCTGALFSGFTMVVPEETTNDAALAMLLAGSVDLVYIYADQASSYKKECDDGIATPVSLGGWDCAMWQRFGTDFAYIHTGIEEYMNGGTTLSMHKIGSGISDILNPEIDDFMESKAYFKLCEKYGLTLSGCIPNDHFPDGAGDIDYDATPYFALTNDLPASVSCTTGYCQCP